MKRRILNRALAALMCVAMVCVGAGCSDVKNMVSGVAAAGVFPVDVNGVTISSRPQKVAVLCPSLADVVVALGGESQLVGVPSQCTQANLSDVTKISGTDAQEVIDLSPDLVITDSQHSDAVSALEESGVSVVLIEPATDREDFERMYSQVGSVFGGGGAGYDSGVATAQDIFLTLDTITRVVPTETVTTACYLYDLDGGCVTGDTLASTIMTYAGVTNVFKSLTGGVYDEFDSMRVSNPNIIFCAPGVKDKIKADSRFADLQAVKNDKIVELETSLVEWQGRTVIEAAYEITAAAFPELLEENSTEPTDPADKINSEVSSVLQSEADESDTTVYNTLQQGDQGEEVLKMQERLDELGYLDTEYDGHYGEYTASCVKEFQTANGIEATGTADADTQRAMYSKRALAKGETAQDDSSADSSTDSSTTSSDVSSAAE